MDSEDKSRPEDSGVANRQVLTLHRQLRKRQDRHLQLACLPTQPALRRGRFRLASPKCLRDAARSLVRDPAGAPRFRTQQNAPAAIPFRRLA